MLINGNVLNRIPNARVTASQAVSQMWLGEAGVSEVMPQYSAVAKSGYVYTARSALQTLSVAGTAMTGLIVYNSSPAGNASGGVDLHLMLASGNVAVTSATLTGIGIAYSRGQAVAPTATTNAVQTCGYLGNANNFGLAYTAATLANAPVTLFDVLHNTAAIAVTGVDTGFQIDFKGSIIVPPQTAVCFTALGAASAASAVNLNLMWAELPV